MTTARTPHGFIALLLLALTTAAPALADCVGNITDDFGDGLLTPRWTDVSGAVGSGSESGGKLVLTKNAGIVGAAAVRLATPRTVCGDFDITVDYDLGSFPAAVAGSGRYHTMILRRASDLALVAGVERYREQANACIPFTDSYKFYTNNPGCTPSALYLATSDLQGRFRLTRAGATIRGYYWNGSTWVEGMNRAITTVPLVLDFDSGTNGTLLTGHAATFDNLAIASSQSVPASSPATMLLVGIGVFAAGTFALRRRARLTPAAGSPSSAG